MTPGQYPGQSVILVLLTRFWASLRPSLVGAALVSAALVGLALVGLGGLGVAQGAEPSSSLAWTLDSTPTPDDIAPGPEGNVPEANDSVPSPMDSEGEREQIDDERENDLTLLATLAPALLPSDEYTFTPARLFQPRLSVPQSIDKPPRG